MNKFIVATFAALSLFGAPAAFAQAVSPNDVALQRLDDAKDNMSTSLVKGSPEQKTAPATPTANDRALQRITDEKENMSTSLAK